MVAIPYSNGPHFTDAREFLRLSVLSTALRTLSEAVSSATFATAGAFTEMAIRGVADDTNWTADTYKTLLSVTSGVGLVSHIVGPTGLAGTPTTTFEITVDGTVYTIAIVATTTGYRAALGAVFNTEGFTTSSRWAEGTLSVSSDKTTDRIDGSADVTYVAPWQFMRSFGTPCLIFRRSLLIRAKSSESNSTTTNQERQSAISYRIFA